MGIKDFENKVIQGDCIEVMKTMPENSVDTVITDPPYGIQFMGKDWDTFKEYKEKPTTDRTKRIRYYKKDDTPVYWFQPTYLPKNFKFTSQDQKKKNLLMYKFCLRWAKECLRVAKPGATLMCFGGSRTHHRLMVAIEDAGWQIFDCIFWIYSTGFPKSLNISKQLQKKYDKQNTKYNLRLVSEADLSQTINFKNQQREVLQSQLSEQSIPTKILQFPDKIWQGQSSLERGSDIQTSSRELSRCKVCQMSERVFENGKERWICNGTPFNYGTADWQNTPKNRSCPSYRPQSSEQQDKQPDSIPNESTSQEIRGDIIKNWEGWGTALKPAVEPIVCARKPLDGTYAQNALKWGVSGLNIDGGRIGTKDKMKITKYPAGRAMCPGGGKRNTPEVKIIPHIQGRFPANIILDSEAAEMLDEMSGVSKSGKGTGLTNTPARSWKNKSVIGINRVGHNDSGGASRFFKVIK